MNIKTNTFKDCVIICLSTLFLTLIIWLPHLLQLNFYNLNFSEGFNTIYRNYDGINYVVIAKTFYYPDLIATLPQSLPINYYAAHFPGYPILISFFALFMGNLKAMLFVPLLFTILSALSFYLLVKDFKLTNHPLMLSLVFLILPARWLIVHSVGSPEPIFIFFTILSLYFFMKFEHMNGFKNIYLAGLFGFLAQLTRPPGILLFIAYSFYILFLIIKAKEKNIFQRFFNAVMRYYPLLLIPFALLLIFSWYAHSYGNFFAYFNSGDNIHLAFPPYQVFNIKEYWVGSIWLEDIIYILLATLFGGFLLFKKGLHPLAFYVFVYLGATMMVSHRDISRYILPVFPFVLIALEKALTSKEFKLALIIVALGIYLYSQNFILQNTAPVANLELFD